MTGYGVNTFSYGADGVRISKNNKSYIYDGDKLLSEKWGTKEIRYIYGMDGIIGFEYEGNAYYYKKNLQGDVIEIVKYNRSTESSSVAARYVYDAYGNHKIIYDSEGIGTLNPIRYRSYYYDVETGLYYLQTRYYDPELGRFISQDNISNIDPLSINGLNLYAYCYSNPLSHGSANNAYTPITIPNIAQGKKVANRNNTDIIENHLRPHWKNKFLDTGTPGFLVLDNEGFQLINVGLSLYKGSFFFDNNENHSIYVALGNAGAYAGINYKKGIGLSASANVLSVGYDGRVLDFSFELLTVGATYMYKDGKLGFGYGAGWYGFTVSIDFIELYNIIFGG